MSIKGQRAYLADLSRLAGRGFAATSEATDAVLRLLVEQLGMRTAFLTRITREAGESEVVAALNEAGGVGVLAGAILPLSNTY